MPTVLRAKCIVVGDSSVGKSAITQVFHSDGAHFPKNYTMTVGVELCVKSLNVKDTPDSVEIYMYDSAGKETFSDLVQKFWSQPSMVMVVFDVTNETSFSACGKWLNRVRAQKPDVAVPGVLVANKVDLDQRRVVSSKDAESWASQNGLEYFEVSAKEMQNVEAPLQYLATQFHKLYQERTELFSSLV